MAEAAETLDWMGQAIDCATCAHAALAAAGSCEPGLTCVNDRRARRIERFFMAHRSLADDYLEHPYFEVRALAGRFCSVFRLQRLVNDAEPEPRASAALRLPLQRALPEAARFPSTEPDGPALFAPKSLHWYCLELIRRRAAPL